MNFRSQQRLQRRWHQFVVAACLAGQLLGCRTGRDVHFLGDAELQHYQQSATHIDYPHVHTEVDPAVHFAEKPPTIRDPYQCEVWELTLQEALELALRNSSVLRTRGTFKSPANPLMTNPERAASKLDPALQETNTAYFQPGPEAALAAFDTQFKTSMKWGRDENVQNNPLLSGGILGGNVLVSENAQFQSSISKLFPTGGTFELSQNWNYQGTNQPFQLFPSYYRGYVRADFRQPLLQGAGVEYNRIARPMARTLPGVTPIDGGVVIARINTDISLADFELAVVNMVKDVEDLYWELYLAYRTYDAQKAAREAAHIFWRNTQERMMAGVRGGTPMDEAQARENYFATRVGLENAAATLFIQEGQLRRMLGLPVSDGRIIRPADEPLSAEFSTDWHMALTESLTRRVELRRQKWLVKSCELQLVAAEQLVKPRLDFVSGYQVNGFGDKLISQQSADGVTDEGYNSAFTTLTRGDQTSWDLGFEFSLPIGLRQALATKRHAELRLSKARAVLAAQELEISHELSHSVQLIDWYYQVAKTSFDRKTAASRQLEATVKEYNSGGIPIDLVLRAEANLASAEVGYFTALVRYNQAITDLRMRRGTLLEENNIHLAESEWTPEAYDEALRRAWARSFALPAPKLDSQPREFVEGSGFGYTPPADPAPSSLPIPPEMGGRLSDEMPRLPVELQPLPELSPVPAESVD